MKVRKLKKLKQGQQGWPDTYVQKSSYGYSTIYCSNGSEYTNNPTKFVHSKIVVTTWHRQSWRS